ncbi:hypothetical protein DTO169C6_3922 [Paecilomyces variotii]|nr:hypothetical protein DTO169C6_3922 [Paecilomyces variotii]
MGDNGAASSGETEAYTFPRGEQEKERLENQHSLFVSIAGGLIHESIPKSEIKRVADVAVGTGIWLFDVARELNNPNNRYDGFDISDLQFPSEVPTGLGSINLTVHDMTKRFPEEYHGKYDLVNVRLVVQALKGVLVPTVISHLTELLRPGGYLQWQDAQWDDLRAIPPNEDIDYINGIFINHMKTYGLSGRLPEQVESGMKEIGFEDVVSKWVQTNETEFQPRINLQTRTGALAMMPKALETVALQEGKPVDADAIKEKIQEMGDRIERANRNGHNWALAYVVVVGRKPTQYA